jgi:four helix bundle protein
MTREKGKGKSDGRMDKPYDLRERSFVFACDIVAFCRVVADRGYVMSRLAGQLLKAGTSIGANLAEGVDGQTKPDFITKTCVALKEARETRYWLRLIAASDQSLQPRTEPLTAEASEFVAMLTTSVKRSRSNPNRGHNQR